MVGGVLWFTKSIVAVCKGGVSAAPLLFFPGISLRFLARALVQLTSPDGPAG